MVLDKDGTTTIVFQENIALAKFIANLNGAYSKIKNDNIIVNLFSFSKLTSSDVLEFLELSNTHRNTKKSFVLVTDKVSYDEVPSQICLVPTLQEARDIIEMEEIERDLELN
ncbi:ribonuclease Z [Cellulophaga sp. F20128]|uniref:ribonuclease Z n=1 Tax=Cellulophaga sp. F20128 TaxID=2926413 RepID=UPI001FF6C10A|nr:ribonuclease Z [Cellulophaga sp. F20128]MCK0158877.1 ribonuclease Z [Cellulophaga sp. F20128]